MASRKSGKLLTFLPRNLSPHTGHRNPELRACLVQVADTGRFAFIEAEKKMSMISDKSSSIGDSVRFRTDKELLVGAN